MPRRVLKANIWSGNLRNNEAASVPFRAMTMGRDNVPSEAISNVQFALRQIEAASPRLPNRLLPHPAGPNGPPGAQWGPFQIFESGLAKYDTITQFAVLQFQTQAGLEPDGKAGIETLGKLDEIMLGVEALPKE